MKLLIKNNRGAYRVSFVLSGLDFKQELDVDVLQQFLYNYINCLIRIQRNVNTKYSRFYLEINSSDVVTLVVRSENLYVEKLRKEFLLGSVECVITNSIRQLKSLLGDLPWCDFVGLNEKEVNDYLSNLKS